MSRYRVSIVNAGDATELHALRSLAFTNSPQFVWHDPAKLGWSAIDEEALIFGAWSGARLVSTMRVYLRTSRALAQHALEHDLAAVPADRFPCLIAGRSATAPEHVSSGLSGVLRVAMLQSLLKLSAQPVRSILAVVYDGAPRVRSLGRAGFDRFACAHSWDSEATPLAPPRLVNLAVANFPEALLTTRQSFAQVLANTTIDELAIAARFGTMLEAVAAQPASSVPNEATVASES